MQNATKEVTINHILPYLSGIDIFSFLSCCKRYYRVWTSLLHHPEDESDCRDNDEIIRTIFWCFSCKHPVLRPLLGYETDTYYIIDLCNRECGRNAMILRCNTCLEPIYSKTRIINYILMYETFFCSDRCKDMKSELLQVYDWRNERDYDSSEESDDELDF